MARFVSTVTNKITSIIGASLVIGGSGYAGYKYALAETPGKDTVISSSDANENQLLNSQFLQKSSLKNSKDRLRRKIKKAAKESKKFVQRLMIEKTIPGMVIGVSFRGHDIWIKGFGFCNIEQDTKCHSDSVMRIASISKPMTMLAVAKLLEEGKLDLDKSIYEYLKPDQFPKKNWEGKQVDITLRQLVSHLGGIRHYKKPDESTELTEFQHQEYYLKENFKDVFHSLDLFKNDDLVAKPGTKFHYTTHGFTLVSAVVESVLPKGTTFPTYLLDNILRKDLGMLSTCLDQNDPLIHGRSNYYVRTKTGVLRNAPYVDNSYKWAGGGILSNIPDLLRFGRVMMYSYLDGNPRTGVKGYLKKETVEQLWTPVPLAKEESSRRPYDFNYGMGWVVIRDFEESCASCASPPFNMMASHSGGAVGASSALVVIPEHEMVVAVFCNMQSIGLVDIACDVPQEFVSKLTQPKHL